MIYFTILCLLVLIVAWKTLVIVPNHQSFVQERLGKFQRVLGPGFYFLIPLVDRIAYRHELREQVIDVDSQSCITKDNIQLLVDGIIFLKVMDAQKASYGIADYRQGSINLAQTTMRSEIGKLSLDSTFSERETVNEKIVKEVDLASDPWGIKVLRYEIQNITLSSQMLNTLEKQMEAERQKRAEITLAQAQKQSTINYSNADRKEKINISEGERQKKINEAEGKAKEISLIADASAKGLQKISKAIAKPGGERAVKMRIVDQFIEEFGGIMKTSKVTVVPARLANIKGFFEGIGKVSASLPTTTPGRTTRSSSDEVV
ncbi:MAG: paraslipin [Proteobacteria bacterium]|nr:paraslipin [Pseudomonadota bacterium]